VLLKSLEGREPALLLADIILGKPPAGTYGLVATTGMGCGGDGTWHGGMERQGIDEGRMEGGGMARKATERGECAALALFRWTCLHAHTAAARLERLGSQGSSHNIRRLCDMVSFFSHACFCCFRLCVCLWCR